MKFLKKLFGIKDEPTQKVYTNEDNDLDYEQKTAGLEHVLGKMYDMVGHAIIPFSIGGAVDMYYFSEHIQGTGFATMELLDPDGEGPLPNRLGTYELLAFTKHEYNDNSEDPNPFKLAERKACGFFTQIGLYSRQAVLNPKETIEIPQGEGKENLCLIFDLYEPEGKKFKVGSRDHHLLLCIQVFRSEMNYARENSSEALIKLLKEKLYYPYSDMDREPVA